ncbi:MAG: hypothetical protein M1833_005324 [Piccolia ochrophora]|nr:MAG: hypothetical protein M1833_005324 [Piccolia ochrophora]
MPSAKKSKHLSHEQIWDDSALIQSWDEALEEYKLYHSMHARGETVDKVLEDADMQDVAVHQGDRTASTSANAAFDRIRSDEGNARHEKTHDPLTGADYDELEDGEVDEGAEEGAIRTTPQQDMHRGEESTIQPSLPTEHQTGGKATKSRSGMADVVPELLSNGVEDSGLKNLMMSWYYAGYYTGLYEGQQQAKV